MKRTLHELQMHEAGFATDRDAEELRRRTVRRRTLVRAWVTATRALGIVVVVATLLELAGYLGFLPKRIYVAAVVWAVMDLIVETVNDRLEPDRKRGAPIGRLVRRLRLLKSGRRAEA